MQIIGVDECAAAGVTFSCHRMPNGEERYRVAYGPASYALVVMPKDVPGAWQNAHFHGGRLLQPGEGEIPGIIELTVVHQGWIAYAELDPVGSRSVRLYQADEYYVSRPGVVHNVYMCRGAVTSTVKYGVPVPNEKGADWYAAEGEFDAWTKSLVEAEIFRLAQRVP